MTKRDSIVQCLVLLYSPNTAHTYPWLWIDVDVIEVRVIIFNKLTDPGMIIIIVWSIVLVALVHWAAIHNVVHLITMSIVMPTGAFYINFLYTIAPHCCSFATRINEYYSPISSSIQPHGSAAGTSTVQRRQSTHPAWSGARLRSAMHLVWFSVSEYLCDASFYQFSAQIAKLLELTK